MNIKSVYEKLISDFISNNKIKDKNAILFFQGFPGVFYKELEDLGYKRLTNYELGNIHHYCDYSRIDNAFELKSILNASGLHWAYYEELISLTQILNDFSFYNGQIIVVRNNLFNNYFPVEVLIDENIAIDVFDEDSNNNDDIITKFFSDIKIYNGKIFFSYVNKHYDIDLNKNIKEIDFFNKISNEVICKEINKTFLNSSDFENEKYRLLTGQSKDTNYILKTSDSKEISKTISILNTIGDYFNVRFFIDKTKRVLEENLANKHLKLFRNYWGRDAEFRKIAFYEDPAISTKIIDLSQGVIISKVIEQVENAKSKKNYSDMIITAPTGTGKSIFFQVPAIHLHEENNFVTIVITPLIALMNDQVNEIKERGINFSTYINSEITFEERQERIIGIKNGKYSIIYLSPELLLANDIKNIIGDREIGLFVVDEAHLVTSWGRDFRVDYWFLGDYIEKLRRGNKFNNNVDLMKFPVICLTATAVFGGVDDVVGDLQKSLNLTCSYDNIYFGSVKRDNGDHSIELDINVVGEKKSNTKKEEKIDLTCKKIINFIETSKKSIIYFPYVSQIEDVYKKVIETNSKYSKYIERYSGSGMDKFEKNESYLRFKESDLSIMLATKAFGMGINIPDVEVVYHYAPTGTLADYVQEIGRAARKLPKGYAMTDYLRNDMNYATVLWGLSGLRHYQIKAIMKKLYNLYIQNNNRNMLISPEVFSFIFDNRSIDNKVKSGLMLLSADLLEKYHFHVINVRAKNIFSIHYICVPHDVETKFLKEYGDYCKIITDDKPKLLAAFGSNSAVKVSNIGNIYEIDLSKVWENEFKDITFAKFKYKFFIGELFSSSDIKISPRIRLKIYYNNNYERAKIELTRIASALQSTFNAIHKKYRGKEFSFDDFIKTFQNNYESKISREYILILLDTFCYEGISFDEMPSEQWKFIERRKKASDTFLENSYCFRTRKYSFIEQNIKRYLKNSEPNSEDCESFIAYLPIPKNGQHYSEFQLVASLLEMFGLATYELSGGRNPQIFVRINDPLKLKRLSEADSYRNILLTEIENRHKRAVKIVNNFMVLNKSNNDRWGIIEHYFLGYDELVSHELELESESSKVSYETNF